MKKGWEISEFENCLEKVTYTNKIQRKDFKEKGIYPIISQEKEFINGYWDNEKDLLRVDKPVVIFGDHTQVIKYVDFDFILGADGVKILKPKTYIDSKYFYYYLQSIDLESLGYARHYRLLKELNVAYPKSLAEQKRIIAILDEAFAAIEKAKANAEKNLANAKELFESYLNGIFANPGKEWEEKKLGEICEVKDGTHDSPQYIRAGIPFVTQKNIRSEGFSIENTKFITDIDHAKFYKRSNVAYEDILISMIGANRGMACLVDIKTVFSIKNVCLIKKSDSILQKYLLYYLKTQLAKTYVSGYSKGGAQEFIGLTELRAFPVLYTTLSNQKSVVDKLDELSAETERIKAIYKQKIVALDELKKSILKKAFEGEL